MTSTISGLNPQSPEPLDNKNVKTEDNKYNKYFNDSIFTKEEQKEALMLEINAVQTIKKSIPLWGNFDEVLKTEFFDTFNDFISNSQEMRNKFIENFKTYVDSSPNMLNSFSLMLNVNKQEKN